MTNKPMPPSVLDMSFEELEARLAAAPEILSEEDAASPTDVHKLRAVEEFGVAYEDVTPEQRTIAKQLNHMELYSGGGLRKGKLSTILSSVGGGTAKVKF